MGAGRYLYLLWDDYQASGGIAPRDALDNAKTQIMNVFRSLQASNPILQEEKNAVEEVYSLSNEEFKKNIEQQLSNVNSDYGRLLKSVDDAVQTLKDIQQNLPKAEKVLEELLNIVQTLDEIVSLDASAGVAQSSVQRIMKVRNEAQRLSSRVSAQVTKNGNIGKGILKGLSHLEGLLQKDVAGAVLEEFVSLSYLTAYGHGLDHVDKTVAKSVRAVGAKISEDMFTKEQLKLIESEIKELNSRQSKADNVKFTMNMSSGTGQGVLTLPVETVQAKNYTDISNISLGDTFTEHTLDDLNFQHNSIFKFFDETFLLNAAASLGNNIQNIEEHDSEILGIIKEHAATTPQETLAQNWNDIVKQTSVLSAIDAIAGKGILNSSKYYVIREKGSQQVKVWSSADIIKKIADTDSFNQILNFKGINAAAKGHASTRYFASDINKKGFVEGEDRQVNKIARSNNIWNQVRDTIANIKIKIGLNASFMFDK